MILKRFKFLFETGFLELIEKDIFLDQGRVVVLRVSIFFPIGLRYEKNIIVLVFVLLVFLNST